MATMMSLLGTPILRFGLYHYIIFSQVRERLRQAVDKNNALEAELEETREKVKSFLTIRGAFIQFRGIYFSFLALYSFYILTAQRT